MVVAAILLLTNLRRSSVVAMLVLISLSVTGIGLFEVLVALRSRLTEKTLKRPQRVVNTAHILAVVDKAQISFSHSTPTQGQPTFYFNRPDLRLY